VRADDELDPRVVAELLDDAVELGAALRRR
jgi:hypothetical protein